MPTTSQRYRWNPRRHPHLMVTGPDVDRLPLLRAVTQDAADAGCNVLSLTDSANTEAGQHPRDMLLTLSAELYQRTINPSATPIALVIHDLTYLITAVLLAREDRERLWSLIRLGRAAQTYTAIGNARHDLSVMPGHVRAAMDAWIDTSDPDQPAPDELH